MSRSSRTSLPPPNTRARRTTPDEGRETAPPPNYTRAPKPKRVERAPEPETLPVVTGSIDPVLAALVMAFVAFGVVMVYSASAVHAAQHYGSGYFFVKRQALFALVALPVAFITASIDYHRLPKYGMLVGAFALLCVTAFGFGHSAGGASRWIKLGPVQIQPAELAKVAFVVWMAWSMSRKAERIRTFSVGFLPHVLAAGVLAALCLRQPDFGSAIMICAIACFMLLAAGARVSFLLGAALLMVPIGWHQIVSKEYRMRRILAFLAPEEHRAGAAYQVWESFMGFGSGGLTGVGIGDSKQKLLFLPEAHTDFISAIVAEELGFIGFATLAIAFGVLVWRGLRAAFRSVDDYGFYLATGLTLLIGAQALTNLAVAVGLFPTKGLVLPFVSSGGSSLVASCFALGVVLNVSRQRVAAGSGHPGVSPELGRTARKRESLKDRLGGVA